MPTEDDSELDTCAAAAVGSRRLDIVSNVGYATPEQAALAEWDAHPLARARVIKIEYEDDDHAVVITDTVPSHPMWNHCDRTNDGWVYTGDHH